MRLSTTLSYAGDPRATADELVRLEQAGLDTIWVPEAYGNDAPTLMGYLAARTETVEIGSGILNVFSRTPALLAQTAAGLDNVSGGRAVLGLGASGPQVVEGFHGVPYTRPVTRVNEVIDVVRMALRREKLVYDGRTVTLPLPPEQGTGLGKPLKLLTHPERSAVPIYVAALGERSVEATARRADGWIPFLFSPEGADAVWGDALRAGLAERDPALAPLEVVAGGLLAIGDDVEHLLDQARPQAALYIGGMGARGKNFYNDLARSYGYEAEARLVQDLYLDGRKAEAEAAIPLELLRQTNLVGPAGHVAERVAAYAAAGVTSLAVQPVGSDPVEAVAALKAML